MLFYGNISNKARSSELQNVMQQYQIVQAYFWPSAGPAIVKAGMALYERYKSERAANGDSHEHEAASDSMDVFGGDACDELDWTVKDLKPHSVLCIRTNLRALFDEVVADCFGAGVEDRKTGSSP